MAATRKATMGTTPPEPTPEVREQVEDFNAVTEGSPEDDPHMDEDDLDELEDDDYAPMSLEDYDPETPLWVGGPLVKEVLAWKEKYEDVYITNVTLEKHVVWRTLRRDEYKHVVRTIEQLIQSGKMTQTEASLYNEEMVVEICGLAPKYETKDFAGDMAGLPGILSQQILEASGFTSIEVRRL